MTMTSESESQLQQWSLQGNLLHDVDVSLHTLQIWSMEDVSYGGALPHP
jgi:hypothetical protein